MQMNASKYRELVDIFLTDDYPTDEPVPASPITHLDDNPFLSPAPAAANVHFDLPSTPPSVGAESFGSPSPTQSEIDNQGHPTPNRRNHRTHRANVTPHQQTSHANATSNPRTPCANATPSRRTPGPHGVVAYTRGTPRAGRHSPLRTRHQEQCQVNEAKKLKVKDVWSFFKKDEQHDYFASVSSFLSYHQ